MENRPNLALFDSMENHQGRPVKPEPLTDAELERLSATLARFGDKRSMNLEQLDGFIAALVCGPDIVLPSEYLPEIWGDDYRP
jgi:hypothetical protein